VEGTAWNSLIAKLPNPHFLQTYEWGQVKAKYGWQPLYLVWDEAGKMKAARERDGLSYESSPSAAALVLKRSLSLGGMSARLSILYAPKGPLLDWADGSLRDRVLNDLQAFARREGAIFLKMDPDVVLGTGIPGTDSNAVDPRGQSIMAELERRKWRSSLDQIQFQNTVLVDLDASEAELLARMKQKTRYNIRLSEKKGVVLRIGTHDDFGMLYNMYAETSVRDGFVIRDREYYKTVWEIFMANTRSQLSTDHVPLAEPLIAEFDNEPVAGIFVFYFAGRAYYVYGMSRDIHREKMPAYLLQWQAMKRARSKGCGVYDLWGAPDVFDERDSMWGVYRFKEGLGGRVVRTLGAWDFAPNPLWYQLYSEIIPRLLDFMRSRGKVKTKQSLGGA
jgi:lipid II:glycine glycyltransferase (peptidoglycan interpeptide bridge formation enzyme)